MTSPEPASAGFGSGLRAVGHIADPVANRIWSSILTAFVPVRQVNYWIASMEVSKRSLNFSGSGM